MSDMVSVCACCGKIMPYEAELYAKPGEPMCPECEQEEGEDDA